MQTDYDVGKAFKRIENEMIDSMMRNIERHIREQQKEGFEWSQWQVEELRSLEEYRRRNLKKYGPQFRKINERIQEAIEVAKERGSSDQEIEILDALRKGHVPDRRNGDIEGAVSNGFFGINDSKMDALLNATQNDMQQAEYAVLRRANDQYRQIIFDAQVYANSGAGTIEQAVDMATKDFLARGIDSIVYKNGARHSISDYADMVIKTAETRAYLIGQGRKRAEWGEYLVIVNKRAGDYPCPRCVPWVGRILIDDIYSGGKPDGKHNLLSEAMAAGFLHPRCRDIFTTYFPGISSEPDPVTKEEAEEAVETEKQEAEQKHAERQAEKFARLEEYSLDPANKERYGLREKEWAERAKNYDLSTPMDGRSRNLDPDAWVSAEKKTFKGVERIDAVRTEPQIQNLYKMSQNWKTDKEMHLRYRRILGDMVPDSLAEFQKLKYNNFAEWQRLKAQYRIVNRYEVIGDVSPKDILRLDKAAFSTKRTSFIFDNLSGDVRKEVRGLKKCGNAAVMEFNGEMFFAHSRVSYPNTAVWNSYNGKYPLIGLKDNRRFSVLDLGDGVPRQHDTEAKFFEYLAERLTPEDSGTVTILSEKHICKSCQYVMKQFQECYPNIKVNVISGKRNYNGSEEGLKTWKYRK